MKKFKMFGLVVVSAMAMLAVVGAASASALEFHVESASEKAPAKIEGSQNESSEFVTDAGSIVCSNGTFTGTTTVTKSLTQELAFSYSGCKFLGFINVKVNPNGCSYKFHSNGEVDVVGGSCTGITFEAAGCLVTVPAQNGLKSVGLKNQGEKAARTILASPAVSGIKYNTSKGCLNGAHTGLTNGEYKKGASTVKALTSGGTQQGLFLE